MSIITRRANFRRPGNGKKHSDPYVQDHFRIRGRSWADTGPQETQTSCAEMQTTSGFSLLKSFSKSKPIFSSLHSHTRSGCLVTAAPSARLTKRKPADLPKITGSSAARIGLNFRRIEPFPQREADERGGGGARPRASKGRSCIATGGNPPTGSGD